jgi:glutamyl-tRNA reductase
MTQKENILAVVGISHKTSSVEQREPYQIGRKDIPYCLQKIREYDGVQEVLVLSTCNRLEFYLVLKSDIEPFEIIKHFYIEYRQIDPDYESNLFYLYQGIEVSKHLFSVISGLESLVLGEYQIQGQVKEAYSMACEHKTVEKTLHKLMHSAFRTGKKVRNQTCLGACKQSVSGVASEIMIDNINSSDTISIIGVNENSKILATNLKNAGFNSLIFVNRTLYKAEMMAETYGGRAIELTNIENAISLSKVVFSSTGAPGHIITSAMLNRLIEQNCCPELIIDMAVPRDIDTVGLPKNIKTYDIGGLQDYLDNQLEISLIDIPLAEKIIEDEVQLFRAWSYTQNNEILNPYAEKFELIRQQVIEENIDQFPKQTLEQVDKLTRHLVHRLQSTFVRALIKTKNGN